jgi:hypothetical protein
MSKCRRVGHEAKRQSVQTRVKCKFVDDACNDDKESKTRGAFRRAYFDCSACAPECQCCTEGTLTPQVTSKEAQGCRQVSRYVATDAAMPVSATSIVLPSKPSSTCEAHAPRASHSMRKGTRETWDSTTHDSLHSQHAAVATPRLSAPHWPSRPQDRGVRTI